MQNYGVEVERIFGKVNMEIIMYHDKQHDQQSRALRD